MLGECIIKDTLVGGLGVECIIWDECKEISDEQWKALDKKFAELEEKLRNKVKKKPKPYYRRGRWE